MHFSKYPKIAQVGHKDVKDIFLIPEDDIVIEEKIDGANFRFMLHEDKGIIFGSRSNELTGDNNQKNFDRCIKYVGEQLKGKHIRMGFVFYGECCIKHSYEYDWDKIPPYLGFDIMNKDGQFLDYNFKKDMFTLLELPMVPLIETKKAKEIIKIDEGSVPMSAYSKSQAEGVVFKNYTKQLFAKYVTDKFREVNKAAFGGSKKYAKGDEELIVAKYCTNARIDKHVFKLIDKGNELEMALMRFLPKKVIEDVYVENWSDILNSSYKLNMKQVRKLIAIRCKSVLNQIITNNALNKDGKV